MHDGREAQDVTDGNITPCESAMVEEAQGEKGHMAGGGLQAKDQADNSTLAGKDRAIVTEEEGKDPNEVGFDGADDPYDPLNQPIWRKWVSVFTVASGAICV